jgi:hypothetical protein
MEYQPKFKPGDRVVVKQFQGHKIGGNVRLVEGNIYTIERFEQERDHASANNVFLLGVDGYGQRRDLNWLSEDVQNIFRKCRV